MRVLWIGYGQAGGKIVDTLLGMNRRLYSGIAINTEQADLVGLNNIREKVLIGQYALQGRGVGANIELAANIAEKALSQVMDRIDILKRRFDPEAFWIAAALGGGTGAGRLLRLGQRAQPGVQRHTGIRVGCRSFDFRNAHR